MYVRIVLVWFISVTFNFGSAVTYNLNDTEYGRMPPLWSLEPYAECTEAAGTYCVLTLHLTAAPGNPLMHTIQEYSAHSMKHYNHTVIERGVCVTTTCANVTNGSASPRELVAPLEACSGQWARANWGLGARVLAVHCTRPAQRNQPDTWNWAVLAGLLVLAALNCAGTLYDYYSEKYNMGYKNDYLLSFSITQNWKTLTDIGVNDAKSRDLRIVCGTRMFTCLCTTMHHVILVYAGGFTKNPHDMEKTYEQTSYQLLYSGLIFIQIFFFTSGFLKSYDFQIDKEKYEPTVRDLPRMVLLRLSRLVPSLAVTLSLVTSWLRLLGGGPLWPRYVTNTLVRDCRASWWHHLLFVNNYTQQGKFCLVPTWYLAADMQVFTVAVLAYLISRRFLLLLLLGVFAPAVHTLLQDLDVVMITPEFLRTLENRTFWILHVLGHNNLPSFILGMLAAERIHAWKKMGGHLVPKWQWSVTQYVSVAGMPLLIISGQWFYADSNRASVLTRAAYNTVARLLFGLLCAAITVSLFSNTPTRLKRLLEWRGWVVPSKLSYGVMLLHMVCIHIMAGVRTELSVFSSYNLIKTDIFVVVASFLAAVPLHLLVEAPFITLFKHLLKKRPQTVADTSTDCSESDMQVVGNQVGNSSGKEKTS